MSNCHVCGVLTIEGNPFCNKHDREYCICMSCGAAELIEECIGDLETGFACTLCEKEIQLMSYYV